MPEYSQIHRLIRILQILSSGRKITTTDLLQRFEKKISRRTLQRDLLTLSEAGIPLISVKTRANENAWSLMSHFRSFIPIPLGINEYLVAHILKENLKIFKETPFEEDIQSLVDKINQLVPEDVFLETKEAGVESLFENYSAGLFDYSPYGKFIDDLIAAILNRNRCLVTYFSPHEGEGKTFYIEPEKIVYYNGGLYIVVYIRRFKKYIILAIQRIQRLKLLDKKFPKDHKFDSKEFWKGKFGLFPGEQVQVRLQFSKDIRHHIEGRQWHSSQKIEDDKEGNLILTMKVGISPELITWILGWRFYVRVIEPEDLINEIKKNIAEIKKLY